MLQHHQCRLLYLFFVNKGSFLVMDASCLLIVMSGLVQKDEHCVLPALRRHWHRS